APVSHIWFFKSVPSRIGYLHDIAPRELEKVLYFAASIVTAVDTEKRAADLNDLEDQVQSEAGRIEVDRDEALAALEDRLARRRDFFAKGKERSFDEDDDFWVRGLNNWAEEQALPALDDARKLVNGLLVELVPQISTEDSKMIRELVRNSAIRDDRKLAPRELETVAAAAEQILQSIQPLDKTWTLFRELEPKLIVNDEQIFRELKDRFGSPYGFGVYFRGGMGAEAIRDLLKDLNLADEAASLREQIRTGKGQKQQRAIKRLKVVSAFVTSENKPEWMI